MNDLVRQMLIASAEEKAVWDAIAHLDFEVSGEQA